MPDPKYLAWRQENEDRLSRVTDWRELCVELLSAAEEMTVELDGHDAHFDLVADRVRELASESDNDPPDSPNA